MGNSTGFDRSGQGSSTKKREKSRVTRHWVDRAGQINSSRSGDLERHELSEAKGLAAFDRFNGAGLGGRPSPEGSIDPRAYSGLQATRYLDVGRSLKTQIGRRGLINGWCRFGSPAGDGSRRRQIWASPREKANLKPLSADSYLPYLDTI